MIWHAKVHNLWQILYTNDSGSSRGGLQKLLPLRAMPILNSELCIVLNILQIILHSTNVFIRGNTLITGNAQTLQTRWLWGLNFVQQCLTFVDTQYGTCFMSPSRHLGFWGGSLTFRSLTTYIYVYISYRSANLQTLHFKYLFNKYTYWIF